MRRSRRWMPQDDAVLRKLYPESGRAACAARLGRSQEAVRKRVKRLRAMGVMEKAPERSMSSKPKPVDTTEAVRLAFCGAWA